MHGLGFIKDEHDDRDIPWSATRAAGDSKSRPARIVRGSVGPVLDQGQTPTCVAHAAASLKMNEEKREIGHHYLMFDPMELYDRCKERDGIPGTDGTFPRVALQVMKERGMLTTHRKPFKIDAYARCETVDDIEDAIFRDGPVMLGVPVDDGWDGDHLTSVGGVVEATFGDPWGGHEILAIGYNSLKRRFYCKNSWGSSWGPFGGYFWLSYDYLDALAGQWDAWRATDARNV